jgi:hypothetical protein
MRKRKDFGSSGFLVSLDMESIPVADEQLSARIGIEQLFRPVNSLANTLHFGCYSQVPTGAY